MTLLEKMKELEEKATEWPMAYGLEFASEAHKCLPKIIEALEVAMEALKDVTCEPHSQNCQNMKPVRPSYTCHGEYAQEALTQINELLEEK